MLPDNVTPDSLNNFFLKLKPLDDINQINLPKLKCRFSFEPISNIDVIEAIEKIKSNAAGPDGLLPKVFKMILSHIVDPLVNIINTSLSTGKFPKSIKDILINPLPKVNEPKENADFRPICRANFIVMKSNRCLTTWM